MDFLLCDEDWLTTTPETQPTTHSAHSVDKLEETSMNITREECMDYLTICLQKEHLYIAKFKSMSSSSSSPLLHSRRKAIQIFLQLCSQMNLASQTVFDAVNYYDRFVSNVGDDYKDVEAVTVACLSISAKFGGEVSIPRLHESQMDESSPLSKTMEVEILKVLQWRLNCVTPYTYKDILLKFVDYDLQPQMHLALSSRVTELLLAAISDPRFIEFRPSTVAVSAMRCSLEELLPSKVDAYISNLADILPQDQKVDIENCHKIMEERVEDPIHNLAAAVSSPVTVLPFQQIDSFDCYIDLSMVSSLKRKREETPLHFKKRLFHFD